MPYFIIICIFMCLLATCVSSNISLNFYFIVVKTQHEIYPLNKILSIQFSIVIYRDYVV